MDYNIYKELFSKEDIDFAIENIANQIKKNYEGKDLIIIALADGGLMFAMDLIKKIDLPLEYYTAVIKSYGDGTKKGKTKVKYFPENIDWTNKSVIIVDDICDSGKTIEYLKKYIKKVSENNDISIESAVLVKNQANQTCTIENEYIGFFTNGEWLVGYGLDDARKYRNLTYIGYKEIKGE